MMKLKHAITILFILFFRPATAPIKDRGLVYDELLAYQESVYIENLKVKIDTSDFSPELFFEALYVYVDNPEIVYRQAVLETGWFTHPRFTVYNNSIGMKPAKSREHLQSGVWKGHATYTHWSNSIKDYALWQEYWKSKGYNMGDYYGFLRDLPYATADRYIETLKLIGLPYV